MLKITNLQKRKVILITLALLILCGIITLCILFSMDSKDKPKKAVYVLDYINTTETIDCI